MSSRKRSADQSDTNNNEDYDLTEENIINILIASDINLGYEQTVKKRDQEDDSFRTFEEILKYARDYETDGILLAGNLFYETNPPLNVITKCISLLRKYCLSDKPVKIDCITDPEWIFSHCEHKIVNFKDPHLNIGLPIFSIYGHRDTPIFSRTGPLDLLATTGLVNYFGKWSNNSDNEINIAPLLLQKGLTNLALYGLSHMNDGKLCKLLKNDKLEFLRDDSITDVCNVLVLHQKRARQNRPENTYVPESLLPDFLNLVLYGHETTCRIKHQTVPDKTFRLSQPGSCIATSLTRGESVPKQVAIMQVYKDSFRMKYLKLKTVRPYLFAKLNLSDHSDEIARIQRQVVYGRVARKSRTQAIEDFVDQYIESVMLPEALKKVTGHENQPLKPLLRLKILYFDENDRFDLLKLKQKYEDKVVNPYEMIVFSDRSIITNDLNGIDDEDSDDEELSELIFADESRSWTRTVEMGISEYFGRVESKKKLKVLSLGNMNKALDDFTQNDGKAIHRTVRSDMQKMMNYLINENVDLNDAKQAMDNYRNESD